MGDRNKIGNFDTSGLGVRDPDFWKQLVELYKMYYTLFFRKKIKITKVISISHFLFLAQRKTQIYGILHERCEIRP